ncbi:MAG TPA: DUF1361 domain-containing protein [Candidatus Saccharimonadales bacterium]|nr:DUF1361 domain-containing protein [Candidatus Saccharimonadales bacterium]
MGYNAGMVLSGVEKRFLQTLGILSALCLGLFVFRLLATGVSRYWFVPENLLLAWLALFFGWVLVQQLQSRGWRNWRSLVLTGLWLLFLPNAWYVMTDFIHVFDSGEISYLYDIAMITALTLTGFLLGFASLFMVHRQLLKRLDIFSSALLIGAVILLISFAIYLGRDLRWNTWDILTNPSGLILNITDRLINPFGYPRALNVTAILFVLISTVYFALWLFLKPVATREK